MTTRHLVDPELAAVLDQLPTVELTEEIVKQVRAMNQTQPFSNLALFPNIEVRERFVPGPKEAPEVRVLLYLPTAVQEPRSVLLWMHGGGYVMGSPEQEDLMVKTMVAAIGCVAVSVDYRLAPETRYPGQIEDCYAALTWVYRHANELGIDLSRIAIGGSSAGGGLAAALGLLTRDRGEISLAF